MEQSKIPGNRMTVIIRDDSPMIHCEDSPTYRRVTFNLTQDQRDMIKLQATSMVGGELIFESISKVFIEV